MYIEKLFYLYLVRLGGAFNADFKESVTKELAEVEAQLEKELGGHWGNVERTDNAGNRIVAINAFIPTDTETGAAEADATKQEDLKQAIFVQTNYSGVYCIRAEYDIVSSHSKAALEGVTFDGWCCPVSVSQTPLIYDLYVDRLSEHPNIRPGKKIGKFELRKVPNGKCDIIFTENLPDAREWTNDERTELNNIESEDERNKYILAVTEKIQAESKAENASLKKHYDEIVIEYFLLMKDWGILTEEDAQNELTKHDDPKDAEESEKPNGTLPSDIKSAKIDSLAFNMSRMKKHYRDFSEDKARDCLKLIPELSKQLGKNRKLKSTAIARKLFIDVSVVSNHFRALYREGLRTVDSIPLPYKPNKSHM